jgi:exodeoxyribonuclease (lambda-induced)
MKIHNFEQGTEEWFKVRLGKFTASDAQAIGNNGKGLETLAFEKVAEILTGKTKDQYTNEDMERGKELEGMARNSYEIETGYVVKQVGFVELNEFCGCSPDGLIGDDGLVEIKCKNNPNFVRHLYEKKIESEYLWQVQMQMYVAGRNWCDFVVFNENFEKTISTIRVERNEEEITKIVAGLEAGVDTVKKILEKLK